MFSKIVLFALFGLSSAIIDLNCTDGTNWANRAFNCENVYSDNVCEVLYAAAAALEVGTATTDRNDNCYSTVTPATATTVNAELKEISVANCPKTCGYCCLTNEFQCENARLPRINCNTVTSRMCKDPLWREVIAADCPNVCGFCLLGGCIDAAPDCALNPTICYTRGLESFSSTNCKRTCGLCDSTSTTAASVTSSTCADTNRNCAGWVRNGFCTNTFYTAAQRRQFCGRSCNLC
ncbi:unnamed protein product [Auanema sp. JU1783]|nr:unnamed protein product [Auanema sp. JU1783]